VKPHDKKPKHLEDFSDEFVDAIRAKLGHWPDALEVLKELNNTSITDLRERGISVMKKKLNQDGT
jgi:hypothetical protein